MRSSRCSTPASSGSRSAPYGGAVVHQLFSRIMGNFADRPDLVGVLMEVDALLTDTGVLRSDYVWGVWRRRP